jgi:hypothetical protein
MSRGVRTWGRDDRPTDLFSLEPAPIEAAPTPPSAAPAATAVKWSPRYGDRAIRRAEKAFDVFKDWLFGADLGALKKADPAALGRRFPPLREDDIAEMIAAQIRNYDRRDEIWRKWQRIR